MLDLIILIVLGIAVVSLTISTIVFRLKYRRMIVSIAQLVIDNDIISNKLETVLLETSKEVNEGFIKFLSDSREAAFSYIENVQQAIQHYLIAVENGNADEITTARMELFSHLPEDSENQSK